MYGFHDALAPGGRRVHSSYGGPGHEVFAMAQKRILNERANQAQRKARFRKVLD